MKRKLLMLLAVLGAQAVPAMNALPTGSSLASVAEAGRRQTVVVRTFTKPNGAVRVKSYTVRGWPRR